MVDDMIKGIAFQLSAAFPEIRIYSDQVEQGVELPCFFVHCIEQSHAPRLFKRHRENFMFEILYIPSKNSRSECETVAYALYDLLEYIPINGRTLRGTERNSKVEDYVLHFFVSYSLFMERVDEEEHMEGVKIYGRVAERSEK